MPKFATLDPKFPNISIVKNKVPRVDKLFQDIKNKLQKRGFWNTFHTFMPFMFKNRENFSFSQNARGADGAG